MVILVVVNHGKPNQNIMKQWQYHTTYHKTPIGGWFIYKLHTFKNMFLNLEKDISKRHWLSMFFQIYRWTPWLHSMETCQKPASLLHRRSLSFFTCFACFAWDVCQGPFWLFFGWFVGFLWPKYFGQLLSCSLSFMESKRAWSCRVEFLVSTLELANFWQCWHCMTISQHELLMSHWRWWKPRCSLFQLRPKIPPEWSFWTSMLGPIGPIGPSGVVKFCRDLGIWTILWCNPRGAVTWNLPRMGCWDRCIAGRGGPSMLGETTRFNSETRLDWGTYVGRTSAPCGSQDFRSPLLTH
jgi:hypothetical protein